MWKNYITHGAALIGWQSESSSEHKWKKWSETTDHFLPPASAFAESAMSTVIHVIMYKSGKKKK